MPLIRKFAIQGHPIPRTAHSPKGPFPPEILEQPRMEYTDEHSDSLHSALDDTRFFKCRECYEVLLEEQLKNHICED